MSYRKITISLSCAFDVGDEALLVTDHTTADSDTHGANKAIRTILEQLLKYS